MAFDVDAARKEGYSDAEIVDYLGKSTGFDIAGARKEGYSDTEVVDYLRTRPRAAPKVVEPEPTADELAQASRPAVAKMGSGFVSPDQAAPVMTETPPPRVTKAEGPVLGTITGAGRAIADLASGAQKNIERNLALPLRLAGRIAGVDVIPPEVPESQRSVMPGVTPPSVTKEEPLPIATARSAEGRPTTPIATVPSPSTDPGAIARNLADVIPQIPGRVYDQFALGNAGNVETIADIVGAKDLAARARGNASAIRQSQNLSEMQHPAMDQFLVRNTVTGLQSIPPSLVSLGIGAVTPGGVAAKLTTSLLPFFMGSQGQSYDELTRVGFSPEQARFYSTAKGLSEALTEIIPMRALMGVLKTGPGKLLSASLNYMWKEGLTEEVNTVINHAVDLATTRPDLTTGQMAQELLDTAASIAVTGLGTAGAAAAVSVASQAAKRAQFHRNPQTEAYRREIDLEVIRRMDPNAVASTVQPGTSGDLAAVMKNPLPLAVQREQQAAVAAAPIEEIAKAPFQKGAEVRFPIGEQEERGTVLELRPGDEQSPGGYALVEFAGGAGTMELPIADLMPATLGSGTPQDPIKVETPQDIEAAVQRIDETRSNEQIEAGNDRKAHIRLHGFNITLETAKGQVRRDSKNVPPKWEVTMPAHYGYIKRTEGADEEGVDVYIGDELASQDVWVVDQIDPETQDFDEHKAMLGFADAKSAIATYSGAFQDASGPSRMGSITHMTMDQFREWVKTDDTTKPVSYLKQRQPSFPTWDTIKPGDQVTLYRGENAENVAGGQWWTTDKSKAERFGKVITITLPAEIIGKYAARGHNGADEFVFPDKRPPELAGEKPQEKGPEVSPPTGGAMLPPQPGGEHAAPTGQEPGGNQPERPRVPQGPDVPTDSGEIREEEGGQTGGGGGAVGGPQVPRKPAGELPQPPAVEPKPEPPKEPKAPKEPKQPKPEKVELTAAEKLHVEIQNAIAANDRSALAKIIYQDMPHGEENLPTIDEADKLVRLVIKIDYRERIEARLRDLEFVISDRQDATEGEELRVKLSAIYRPPAKMIQDIGEKIGGKRADEAGTTIDKVPAGDAEKAVNAILNAVRKDALLTHELPGQSFGQMMFLEAFWDKLLSAGESMAPRNERATFKQWLIRNVERDPEHNLPKIKEAAKAYAETLGKLQKAVEGTKRVGEAYDALRTAIGYESSEMAKTTELLLGRPAMSVLAELRQRYEANEDSTDQTNRAVKKDPEPPTITEIIRKGEDWRKGKNVEDADFQNTFGFRGVDFGDWVTGPERQAGLNMAYDALMDMAKAIDFPPSVIGLGKQLALGFGARGRGGRAAATFHPDNVVINLTRTRGNGNVSHEWEHGLEHHILHNGDPKGSQYVREMREALKFKINPKAIEREVRAKLSEKLTHRSDRNVPPKERAIAYLEHPDTPYGWWGDHNRATRPVTNFRENAVALDGGETGKYWSKPVELMARSWEGFIYDETKGKSPYLVGPHVEAGYVTKRNGFDGASYPIADEREYFQKIWKMFIDGLEITDQGVRVKAGAKTVTDRLKEEMQTEADAVKERLDAIMEEMGISQTPSLKDGSMMQSMFYHLRSGWWPTDKIALRRFVAQAHQVDPKQIDDLKLRDGIEDFEAALARYAGQLVNDWQQQGLDERAIYDKLFDLYDKQPRLDVRTSEVVLNQQFSTPLPLAYAAGILGHVDAKTVVFDVTAGNGLLTINANPKNVIANELSERRFKNLTLLETRAHKGDALTAAERGVYRAQEADTLLFNPPFGLLTDPQKRENYTIKRIDQLIAMDNMGAMADKGRAVLILGASMTPGLVNQNEMDFFHWLYTHYNVVDHFEVTGKLYERQGASWPIRMLVIAGRSPSKLQPLVATTAGVIDRMENRDELWTRILEARDKAKTPVAGGVSPRVVGPRKEPGGKVRAGQSADDGSGVPGGVVGEGGGATLPGGGAGGETGGGGRTPVGNGPVGPGQVPGGRRPAGVGGEPAADAGLRPGDTGALQPGEPGGGKVGGGESGLPHLDPTDLGGTEITDADLDDIFDAPKKRRPKAEGGPKTPRKPKGPKGPSVTKEISTGDREQDDILNAMRAILEGRAEQPKPPVPPKTVDKPKSEALSMAVYSAVEARLLREPDWWIKPLAERVNWPPAAHALAKTDLDLSPRFSRDLDHNIYRKLQPHFQEMWDRISAVAKDFRDRMVLFRDRVIEVLGEKIVPYAKAFIQQLIAAAEEAKRKLTSKKPIENAVETGLQKFYVGLSGGDNTGIMTPADQLLPQKRALAALDARLRNDYPGGVDEFVQKMVGYESIEEMFEHFGGYQVDTIGLAIEAMMRNRGFIIGDDTGVGKGRQAAAIIDWAINQGKTPIFVTAGDTLYSDMYRDMRDIGKDHIEWIQPTNTAYSITDEEDVVLLAHTDSEEASSRVLAGIREKIAAGNANFMPEGKKVIFTTYDQLKGGGGVGPRRAAIEAIASTGNAVLILDEAHKASGASGVGGWLTRLLNEHKPPVTYLSATWAKRPDNLYVYSQTDLRLIAAKFDEVVATINAGGPQLQTVISEMLVDAGQMVRRERSYNGIKPVFDIDDANFPVDTRTMDEVTERLRAIQAANREFVKLNQQIIDQIVREMLPWTTSIKKNDLKVDPLNFASVLHNYVKQFLLAVKADHTVEMVLDSYNHGEKPVIALENTMESALTYFVESEGIDRGDSLEGYSWASVMRKAEESARRLTIKVPGRNEPVRLVVPLHMLPGDIASAFQRAQSSIGSFESSLPSSPIDYLLWKLNNTYTWKQNGKDVFGATPPEGASGVRKLRWGEITGRTLTVDYQDDGTTVLGTRDKTVRKRSTIIDYQNGQLDGAILNISGSTGISMHASVKAKDQRQRHMFIAQPLADIAEFKQISGRINRTGQVELPLYTFIGTALPSEKRPLSALQRKLRSLTSQTSSGTQSVYDIDTTDFINQYGDLIVTRWLRANPDMLGLLNLNLPEEAGAAMPNGASTASGRIAILPVADQQVFYDEIETTYGDYIRELTQAGRNKLITPNVNLQAKLLSSNEIVEGEPYASSPFVMPAHLDQLSVLTQHQAPKPEAIIENADKAIKELPSVEEVAEDLKLAYDEAMNQVALRIQDYEKRLREPSLPPAERHRIEEALNRARATPAAFAGRRDETLSALQNRGVGSVYTIIYNEDEYTGVIVNRSYQKQRSGNPYSPSRFSFSIVVNAPLPTLHLTLASIENEENFWGTRYGRLYDHTRERAIRQIEQDFDPTAMLRGGGRERRYMVVGNIPAGYNAVKNAGEIIRFTYEGSTPQEPKIRTGVLMPQKFNPQTGVKETQPVRNLDAAERFLMLPYDYGIAQGTLAANGKAAEESTKRWIDFGYTAQEIFDISAFGLTDESGAIRVTANTNDLYLRIRLKHDSRIAKVKKQRDELLSALQGLGVEMRAKKGADWMGFVEAGRAAELVKLLSDRHGLSIKPELRPFYKRIADHITKPEAPKFSRFGPRGAPNNLSSGEVNAKLLRLRDDLGRYLGRALPPKMFTRGSLPQRDLVEVKKLEAFFGKNIIVFKNNNQRLLAFNGATWPSDPNTIYVDQDSSVPFIALIGHEFLHTLKETDEAAYEALLGELIELYKNTERYQHLLSAARAKEGKGPAGMDLVEEELAGDVFGDALMDSRLLARLYGEQPTLWQKILQAVLDFLEGLGVYLRTPLNTHRYVSDLAKAREIVERVLSERKPERELATMTLDEFSALPREAHAAIHKDREAFAKLLPKGEPKFSRNLPPNIKVEQRPEFGDILGVKKGMWLPREAFRTYPLLGELQRFAMQNEVNMSKTLNRLMGDYETLRKPFIAAMVKLDEERWGQLIELVLQEEAEQAEYTDDELTDLGITDEKVRAGHKAYRELIVKMGRLVDMHRRSMLPKLRARKATLLRRMAQLRNMSDPQFMALWTERQNLRRVVRNQSRNAPAAAQRLAEVERDLQQLREGLEEYEEMALEVDQIDAKLAETSIRRKKGYFPHKFFGSFVVYDIQEREVLNESGNPILDENGEPKTEKHHVLVAGKEGFYPSMQEAIAAAKGYLESHPNADLLVKPLDFKYPNSNATTLTDKSFEKFTRDVSSEFGLHGQDLYDVVNGVAKKRFRRRIAGFTQLRKGVEGFSVNLDRVMRAHIAQVVNYVYLDKLKYQAINTQEKSGLSPAKATRRGRETLARMFDNYIRDLNNLKQPSEIAVDEFIVKLMDRPWATPATIGAFTGSATALPLMVGVSTNPLSALLLGGYIGFRFYDSLKNGGEFPSRVLTSDMMSDMAHAKLGLFFNVMSAVVNLTQTMVNTLPVLGPKYTMVGMVKLEEAIRSFIAGKPNGDWRLLERTDLVSVNRYTDEAGRALLSRRGLLGYASLIFFDTAEKFNRATAFLGGYYREHDKGRTAGESFRAGESVLEFTQHHYGNASKPEIIRNIFARVPLQFKNYFAQQIGFTWELGRYGVTGERHEGIPEMSRAAIVTHLFSLTLLAGILGLPIWWPFSIMAALFDWDAETELKKWYLKMQAAGELGAAAWKVMIKGSPAMLGEDLSARAGMGDQFFPSSQRDVRGPWIGTIADAVKIGEAQGTLVDQLANAVPGIGKPLKVIESMANGMPMGSAFTDSKAFYEALQDDKLSWRNRLRSGMMDYDETTLGKGAFKGPGGITVFPDLARMAAGSTPTALSEGRDRIRVIGEIEKRHEQKAKLFRNLVVNAIYEHQHDEKRLDQVLDNIIAQMERQGYEPNKETISRVSGAAMTPREERALKVAPRPLREELEALFPKAPEPARP